MLKTLTFRIKNVLITFLSLFSVLVVNFLYLFSKKFRYNNPHLVQYNHRKPEHDLAQNVRRCDNSSSGKNKQDRIFSERTKLLVSYNT